MICRSKRVLLARSACATGARPAKLCLSVFLSELVSEGAWDTQRHAGRLTVRHSCSRSDWRSGWPHAHTHTHTYTLTRTRFFPHRAPHVMSNMHTHIRQAWLSWASFLYMW